MSDFEYDYLGSLAKRNAILLCPSDERREYLKLLAKTYQCVIIAENIDFEVHKPQRFSAALDQKDTLNEGQIYGVDLLLIDLDSDMDVDEQELSKISSYLIENEIEAVVWTRMDNIDDVFALLPALQCQFLVDSNPLEAMPALTGLTGREVMSHLSDISENESNAQEYAALHRISGELASLAKTLAKIAVIDNMTITDTQETANKAFSYSAPDDFMNHSVFKDKPISFKPFPNAQKDNLEKRPFIENSKDSSNSAVSVEMVKKIIKLRRMRDNYFESALFADPAWDILLDLMVARLSNNKVSVSSLCIAAAVPATTALRWITSMTKNGMLERKSDPVDARRVFMDLSDNTFDKLEAYLMKVMENDTPIV